MIQDNSSNNNSEVESNGGFHSDYGEDIRLHSSGGRRLFRIIVAGTGVLFVGLLVSLIGIFLMFQGGAIENDVINQRIERSITSFLGARYEAKLGATRFEFRGIGLIAVTSSNVTISERGKQEPVAVIGKVLVGVQPLSLLRGNPKVNSITLEAPKINVAQFIPKNEVGIPPHMGVALDALGQNLAQLHTRLNNANLKKISIVEGELSEFYPGPRSSGRLLIKKLVLTNKSTREFAVKLDADSGFSQVSIDGNYARNASGEPKLELNFNGIDLREWTHDPLDLDELRGFAASNSRLAGSFNLPFNEDNTIQQPVIQLRLGEGDLRLGRKGRTDVKAVTLNFRLFPRHERIILERSQLIAGDFRAQFVGAITPVVPDEGLAGDLDYTLVIERAEGKAAQPGEKVFPGAMIVEGGYNKTEKLLNVDQLNLTVAGGNLVGSASLGFGNETPSLVFNGVSQGMPIAAVKQLWPVFIATPARKWMRERIHGGKVTSATINASIPGGVLGRIHLGKRFEEDQLLVEVEVEGTRFDTFGELPPVRNASGRVRVRGMETLIELDKAVIYVADGEPVTMNNGSLKLSDFGTLPVIAKTSFLANGSVAGLAQITNAKPLNVMNRLDMTPSQWSGKGEVDVVANFPIKRKLQYGDVDWQALVRIDKATSSRPVTGRNIANADVVIDISPDKAVITGDSTIDGIRGNVLMIEPVGKNSKTKRKRVLKARMGPKARKKFGVAVEPVITGIIDVVMEQYDGRKTAQITVDLKEAKVELPWIGWQKGVGIPATANFQMVSGRNITKIHNLKLRGQGFSLDGDLVFDKYGIKTVDIPKVALNEGDDLAVRVRRKNNVFTITANGSYFDGRGLVNKLFHQQGIADEQGAASFKLSADIKKVRGFGNRYANNLILHYAVKEGWLDSLNLNTGFGNASRTTIEANTVNGTTDFQIRSQNAGSALSFLNLYTHMRNGVMVSNLKRKRGQPFFGNVVVEKFTIVDEPKLKKLVSNDQIAEDRELSLSQRRELQKIQTNKVNFISAQAKIEKGQGYLKMDGSLTGVQIGLTYDGTVFDANNRMNVQGTFMPAFGLSRMVSAIPFVGQLLSNGKDSGLIGINYHLSGPIGTPKLVLNPLSVVAPGVFKKVFQPKRN